MVQLLGESAVDALSKNKKPRAPFSEGEANASLGAISLFSGVLALLFSCLLFASTFDRRSFDDIGALAITVISAAAFLAALLAYRAGRNAPKVTRRHLGMARVGKFLSIPAMFLSVVTLAMCGVRLLQWTH